jgi:predicted Zn-dependent protease
MVEDAPAESVDELVLPDPFEIISIRSVAAPNGMPAADWHRYEISQGHNRIVGYRAGAADTVREAVELIVLRLNMRRRHRRGRVHVVLQSKASQRLLQEHAGQDR